MVRPGLLEPVRVSAVVRIVILRWAALAVVLVVTPLMGLAAVAK